jgi:signal transduction histidine kinase
MRPDNLAEIQDLSILKKEYAKLAQKEHYFRIINEFAVNLLDQQTEEEIVWAVAKNAIAKMGLVDCVVYLIDDSGKTLIQKAAHGPKNPAPMDIKNPITIPVGSGIVGTVALSGKGEKINDTSNDPRYILDDEFRNSEMAVPIKMGNQILGVIDSEHPEKNFFTKEHFDIFTTIAAMTATKIMHAKAAQKVQDYQKGLETEIENKTKELKETIEKLRNSNQDLESFAYAAAHDLQEPLRTIISYIQLVERKLGNEIDPKIDQYIRAVLQGGMRMKVLLEGILNYSRISNTSIYFQKIDLNEMLATVAENLQTSIKEHHVDLKFKDLPTVKGAPVQILQLFQNLISNSIKFRKKDTIPIIQVQAKPLGSKTMIMVCDNGIGIDKKHQNTVFQIFKKLHNTSQYQGSGIGLALCKRIIELHGGEIEITSRPEKGTCISFSLPAFMH